MSWQTHATMPGYASGYAEKASWRESPNRQEKSGYVTIFSITDVEFVTTLGRQNNSLVFKVILSWQHFQYNACLVVCLLSLLISNPRYVCLLTSLSVTVLYVILFAMDVPRVMSLRRVSSTIYGISSLCPDCTMHTSFSWVSAELKLIDLWYS